MYVFSIVSHRSICIKNHAGLLATIANVVLLLFSELIMPSYFVSAIHIALLLSKQKSTGKDGMLSI